MAEDAKTTGIYSILLTKIDKSPDNKKVYAIGDFHYLAFIRDPIRRQATFISARAMSSLDIVEIMEKDIDFGIGNNQNFPQWELTINDIIDADNPKSTKPLYTTTVLVLQVKRDVDNISSSSPTVESAIPIKLIMVHPVAFQMNKHTFNRQFRPNNDPKYPLNPSLIAIETIINKDLDPITPNNIKSFTDIIIEQYAGDPTNIKQHILADRSSINLLQYKEITVPPTLPTINVAEYINAAYKPFSTPSYWFFDSFNFGNYDGASEPVNGKIPVWCLLINFFNCATAGNFMAKDMSPNKYSDTLTHTHKLESVPFNDFSDKLSKPNAVLTIHGPDMTQKTVRLGEIPGVLRSDGSTQKQSDRLTSIDLYAPDFDANNKDSVNGCINRVKDCMSLFSNQIGRIEFFETTNTSPEWLQFGKLYNFERDQNTGINKFAYIHTPVMIMNIFKRRQTKESTLECINKYIMLRLYGSGSSAETAPSAIPETPAPAPTELPPAPVTATTPPELKPVEVVDQAAVDALIKKIASAIAVAEYKELNSKGILNRESMVALFPATKDIYTQQEVISGVTEYKSANNATQEAILAKAKAMQYSDVSAVLSETTNLRSLA